MNKIDIFLVNTMKAFREGFCKLQVKVDIFLFPFKFDNLFIHTYREKYSMSVAGRNLNQIQVSSYSSAKFCISYQVVHFDLWQKIF